MPVFGLNNLMMVMMLRAMIVMVMMILMMVVEVVVILAIPYLISVRVSGTGDSEISVNDSDTDFLAFDVCKRFSEMYAKEDNARKFSTVLCRGLKGVIT